MVDQPPFGRVDVAKRLADRAVFAQAMALGLADKAEADDRRTGVERADAEHDRIEAAGEFVDFGEAAAFDQGLPRLGAVDQRRRRDEIAVGVVGAREFPREFSRIDRTDMSDAADQRHHRHRFRRAFAQVVERLPQREAPAEADLHVVGDEFGNDRAERGADWRGRIGVRGG